MAMVTDSGTSQTRTASSCSKMNTKCNFTHVNNINMTMIDIFGFLCVCVCVCVRLSDNKHRLLRL